jgi:hypothetical protein
VSEDYERRSFGAIAVGTGEKPGIVVVDFQLGFTGPQYSVGRRAARRYVDVVNLAFCTDCPESWARRNSR